MEVYFWQNIPSHIQAPGLRELSRCWKHKVYGVWADDISDDRRRLGWQDPDMGNLESVFLPRRDWSKRVDEIIAASPSGIHVFSGLSAYEKITYAWKSAVRNNCKNLGLMAEPGIAMGLRGLLRPLRARVIARGYLDNIRMILAMGNAGVDFYRKAGFSRDVLYPFMYQADAFEVAECVKQPGNVRLIYIGKFIRRKGFDTLLSALSRMNAKNWHLTVVGDDDNLQSMRGMATAMGVAEKISWLGAVASDKVSTILSNNDLCVVPSRFEGWGVVTNEAIQMGVPVICSDMVTSRDLVEASGAGAVFHAGNSSSLCKILEDWISNADRIRDASARATAYRRKIEPVAIGLYLSKVLTCAFNEGERPVPPWQCI